MFSLYRKENILLTAPYCEDLISLVEILKRYNKQFINRKEFVVKKENQIIYKWKKE